MPVSVQSIAKGMSWSSTGQGRHDLLLERQAAAHADEFALRKKSVVESHSTTDAITRWCETQARYDHQVNVADREGLAAGGSRTPAPVVVTMCP
jgi:hypothetical protein